MSTAKIFIGAEGAALAFEKLSGAATWPETAHIDAGGVATPPSGAAIATDSFDATNYYEIVLHITPSELAATWSLSIYHAKKGGGINSTEMYKLRLSELTDETGRVCAKVDTRGLDYIYVNVDAVSAGTVTVEVAPVEFDDGEA